MKFLIITALIVAASGPLKAESITSGSKFPIILNIFKGSATCTEKQGKLDSAFTNISKSAEKTKGGGLLDKLSNALNQTVNTVMLGDGCESIGKEILLKPGESKNAPIGAIIVAFKDPFLSKKLVNPMPAVCTVKANKDIKLVTRKSETLGSFLGIKGDGGLKCQ